MKDEIDLTETNFTIYPSQAGDGQTRRPRRTAHTDVLWLLEWASDYEKHNAYPRTPFERFAIGFYQTAQAEQWKRAGGCKDQKWEAWAGVTLHLMMVVETVKWQGKGIDVIKAEDYSQFPCPNSDEVLYRWGRAQQVILYWWTDIHRPQTQYDRKSRINLKQLGEDLFFLIHHYRALIPAKKLAYAIEQSADIMCGKL